MSRLIQCPQCKKEILYSQENPHRPFCSERCKLIDFGEWADGKYAIPTADSAPSEDDDEDGRSFH